MSIKYSYILYSTLVLKNLLFLENNLQKEKALQQKAKGLRISKLPRQDEFRNFCMNEETEKVYCKLEEVIGVC